MIDEKYSPYLTPSALFLIAANLMPLYGVLFQDWSVFDIMILFWFENVVLGVMNVLKMLTVLVLRRDLGAIFMIPFFIFHYGIFTSVHGAFIFIMFGSGLSGQPEALEHAVLELLTPENLLFPFLGLCVSHFFSLIFNFILRGEYKAAASSQLIGQPYSRVVILHITILIGGGLALLFKSHIIALLLLIIMKIGIDLTAHLRERKKFSEMPKNKV